MKMAETEVKRVHLDEVLLKFGLFKRYQMQAILLLGFAILLNGMHCINFIFVAEEVPYRCRIEQCDYPHAVFETTYNFTAPADRSTCYKYGSVHNYSECSAFSFNSSSVERCSDWIYTKSNSFVSEFQLGCQDWKRTFVGTVHSIGVMIGLFFQGQLSDKIGRKAAIIIAGLAAGVFGLVKSFAETYIVYIIIELLEAIFGDNYLPAFIMSVELVHSDHKLNQLLILCIMSAIGGIILPIVAHSITYWRHFIRTIYAPSLLLIFYYFIMDESVRWLLSKGKKKRATKVLIKMAKTNNMKLDDNMLQNLQCEQLGPKSSPLRDTFKSKIVVKRFIVCLIWWMSCTFICYGLIINVVSLSGNKYVNFALMSLTDIPASIIMVYALKRFNRKKPLFASFMIAGLLCLVQPFIPKVYMWLSTGLYLLGRFVSSFTFTTVYMYTSELFPTYTRNSMHSMCSSIGRIGSILAPMTPLLTKYMDNLPIVLIGAISILAGLTTLLVPDIADETLPDNVQQAECIGNCHRVKS